MVICFLQVVRLFIAEALLSLCLSLCLLISFFKGLGGI